ncbi:flagellar biosynthetic protein FliR [Lichenihabitans sp. Uapishka_5]|uniref:flagellar biosynthetic protein FliR n=1 Tax=Lichenihabitans sp. Uapishka_5 TaxID=3037302 RepID=UPI0029E81253|nr:flagellar biosynthetic protein FliR [Lichenihabitans sp. Uapishka_5]MDX7950359.1 flagellar biosynthetic protein FliR [Lichenihabitans sp. Uapishka_5]
MTGQASDLDLVAFLIFCRVGACLLLMPGYSSSRIPIQVRLFVAVSLSLTLAPLSFDTLQGAIQSVTPLGLLRVFGSELLIGITIGLMGRFFFIALEAIGMAVAMSIGITQNLGVPINEDEPLPAVTTLITLSATLMIFLTDQHLEVLRAIAASYGSLPVSDGFTAQFALNQLGGKATLAFTLALRLGTPFLILALVMNFGIGLASRLVPNVQTFFLASPIVLMLGLVLLYLTMPTLLRLFTDAFSRFLVSG